MCPANTSTENARDNFHLPAGRIEQRHLSVGQQRIVIVTDIADRVALQLQMAVLHLSAMDEIAGVGKSGDDAAIRVAGGVPAAVIEMQMGVEDDVHVFGLDVRRLEAVHQQLSGVEDAALLFAQFVANAGFDHYGMSAGADDDGVGAEHDLVSRVGRGALFPERLGHHAEHGSTIEQIGAVAEDGQLEIAQGGTAADQVMGGMRHC